MSNDMLETTHDYFMKEHRAFMEAMGTRTFWSLSQDQRDGALTGLTYAYTGCTDETPEQEATRRMAMELAIADYNRRSIHVALFPLPTRSDSHV